MSKPLIYSALVFQAIGLVWDFVSHLQSGGVSVFFETPHWPIFLGFILLLVAVLQSLPKKKENPNKDNKFLP